MQHSKCHTLTSNFIYYVPMVVYNNTVNIHIIFILWDVYHTLVALILINKQKIFPGKY